MMGDVPEGWVWAPVSEVTEAVSNVNPEDYPERQFSYVDISSIDNQTFTITDVKRFKGKDAPSRARRPIRTGDVLFSNVRTYLRNVALVPEDLQADLCSTGFTVLRPNAAVLPRYLFRSVLSDDFIDRVTPQQTGTHYPATSDRVVRGEHIPLPPFPEQRRIVDKLEQLLGKVDACQQRLAKVPALLKRFRQSVHAAACSGRLTADWRDLHPNLESAPDALRTHASRTAGRERNIRRLKPALGLTLLDFSGDFPTSWAWFKVRELVERGAILDVQDGNHGELYPRAEDFGDAGVPYISAEHVIDDIAHIAAAPRLKQDKAKQLRIGFASANDVILTHNATVGRVAVLPRDSPDVVLSTSTTYYRVDEDVLLADFLATFLRSHYFQSQLQAVMEQTTRNQVSVTKQVEFGIAVPPIEEQREIVRHVQALCTLAAQEEAGVANVQAFVNRLSPALLAKAFRGGLVPTEAELARREGRDYEPGAVLLERVQRERAGDATSPKASIGRKTGRRMARSHRGAALSR